MSATMAPVSWQRMAKGIDDVRQRLERAAGALARHSVDYAVVGGNAAAMDVFLDGPDAKSRDAVHILWAGEKAAPDAIDFTPELRETENSGSFHLVPLEDLVRMKLVSFRDKDRMHLRDLIAVRLVDASWPPRFSQDLARRLQTILDDPEG